MPVGTPVAWLEAADAEEVHLTFPASVHGSLQDVLFPNEGHPFHGIGERGAFCVINKSTGTRRVSYLVEEVVIPESENDLRNPAATSSGSFSGLLSSFFGIDSPPEASTEDYTPGYEFSEEYHERAVERARDLNGGLLRIHTHPAGVQPSGSTRSLQHESTEMTGIASQ